MSNRRSHLILVGLILAALAGVALLAFPSSPAHKKVTLGLDLQGGLEVVLKAVPPPGKTCDSACMDRSVSIMRSRIDKLGVSEPEIRKQGKDQIVIQLAGVHDVNKAAQIIGTTAQLQFYDFEVDTVGPSNDGAHHAIANGSLYDLLSKVKADTKKGASSYYLFNAKKKPVAGPEATRERLLNATLPSGRRLNGEVPEGFTVLAVPPKQIVISCDQATTGCQGVQQADATAPTVYYLFKYDPNNPTNPIPEATGEDLKLSDIAADISTQGQGNVVRLGFTGKGADKFHDITRKEAQRGAADAAAAGQTGSDAEHDPAVRAALRDRARRPAPVDAVYRLQAEPGRDRPDAARAQRSRTSRASARRRTWPSSCRPARCRSSSSRSSAPTSRPRSARTRSRRRSSPR